MKYCFALSILILLPGAGFLPGAEETEFETRVYEVPRNFAQSARPMIEGLLSKFEGGASAIYDPEQSTLTVRNAVSELEQVEKRLDAFVAGLGTQIFVIYERIEVDHLDFSDWLLENRMEYDATELRMDVQGWAKEGRAKILDTTTVTTRSGQRAKTESVKRHVYGTEITVGDFPNQVELSGESESPGTPVTNTAFETRNLGITLEVDSVLGIDEATIDLNLSPDLTELEGRTHWPVGIRDSHSSVDMPTFYKERVTTQVSLLKGRYVLLGTTEPLASSDPNRRNPLVLNFVRADVGKVAGWKRIE